MADNTSNFNPDEIKQFADQVENLKTALFTAADLGKDLAKAFGDTSFSTREIFTGMTRTKDALSDITDLYSRLGTSYIKLSSINERVTKNELMRESILKKINDRVSDELLSREELSDLINIIRDDTTMITTSNDAVLKTLVSQLDVVDGLSGQYSFIASKLKDANDRVTEMESKLGMVGRIMTKMQNIPILGQILNFKAIARAMEDEAARSESTMASVRKKGQEAFRKEGARALKDPTTYGVLLAIAIQAAINAFKELLNTIFKIDNAITKIANNLGVSKQASLGIYRNFIEVTKQGTLYANTLDKALLSLTNQMEALTSLQDGFSTNAMFTQSMVQNQLLLTKQMGLTQEEAIGIQKFSLLTGKSSETILQSAIKQNKEAISYRKIIKEISSISAELSMRYRNDPDQIAKAVIQANKLGMTLEETRKISSSLLNFEQSIEGELESELLLGRQFNFEKARELALAGKSAEAAGELFKQIGGVHELEKMNVIQRERLASAIGLSVDELTKASREQEILNKLGFQNRDALQEQYNLLKRNGDVTGLNALQDSIRKKENGELLLSQISQLSVQQRFEESMNKVKEIFADLVSGPFLGFVKGMASFLSNTTALKAVLIGVAGLVGSIAVPLITLAAVLSPTTAIVGGLAAAGIVATMMAAMGSTSVGDFQRSPGGTIIMSPEGTFRPSKKDYITASTNPPFQGGDTDNSAMIAKMDELIYHTAAGRHIKYDTVTAGTAHGMSYNSYA